MPTMIDVTIIGAGIVGSLIARKLSSYDLNILVLDKENDVGNVTSMANSAIVHSGYDPKPGSLKAILNVKGNALYPKMCEELDVSFDQIGSLTVAIYDSQLPTLTDLAERSKQNGVPVKLLSKEEVLAIEPNLSPEVKGALLAPTAGIVNPFTLTVHAMENACDNGVTLHLDEEVISIDKIDDHFKVNTTKGSYETKVVIDAAGVYSDKIHEMVEPIDYKVEPRKGEYMVLDHYGEKLVNHVIFPLPSEKGKGILVTKTTSDNYLVGPSSEFVDDKEDLSTDKLTLDDVRRQATLMVPNIPFNQVIRTFSGLRPTPTTHDFILGTAKCSKNFILASGIESPGLASSPAIADYVVENFVSKVLPLVKKENWNPRVRKHIHPRDLSEEEQAKLVKEHKEYGEIVCNCEKVSLGEILDELSRSVPPKTIKALKKRTRAGFGKCQGGFCQPIVLKLLAEHYHLDMSDILLDKDGSNICRYHTKEDAKND